LGTFVKDGTGTLSVGGALLNFARLQINDGNLDLTPASSVTYPGATATLANTALASITLGDDLSLGGLNGGGALGGNVRPESTVSAVTLTFNNGSGSYAGSLQDNGTAILSIDTLNRPSQILTGVNTYSGTTRVTDGSLTFAGSGSALQTSSITISRAATLVLDNSVGNVTNRIPDTAPITLSGTLSFLGNGAAPSSETAGSLLLGVSVTSKLIVSPDVTQSSSLTLSSFGQASSTGVGAVIFQGKNLGATPGAGTANIYFTTTPTMIGAGGSAGSNTVSIVPYALGDLSPTGTGSTFVTYGTNGIRPLADAEYANNNFGVAGANVNIDGTTTVSTNSSINSLRLKNGGVVGGERYGDGE
jgi:autotransporter-associated beta strand protein